MKSSVKYFVKRILDFELGVQKTLVNILAQVCICHCLFCQYDAVGRHYLSCRVISRSQCYGGIPCCYVTFHFISVPHIVMLLLNSITQKIH